MVNLCIQFADLLVNGAAYILAVILGTSENGSVFTNFNFFTKVSSEDNPFLFVLMQGMVGSSTARQFGAMLYQIAFILFGVLAAVQIFKAFINPASRGNASPMRTILWVIFSGFLLIYGQDILYALLSRFTSFIQTNFQVSGVLEGLSNVDSSTNLIKWYDVLNNSLNLNRVGAALICAFGVGGALLKATITYLERYLSYAVTIYLSPFASAMAVCDDTRRSTVQWIQSVVSQTIAIILSIMFLYFGSQAMVMDSGSIKSWWQTTLTYDTDSSMAVMIIRSVGATAFFSLSSGCEKFLSVFGIQTMHLGDTAQAVAAGARNAMIAVTTGIKLDKDVGSLGTGIAARGGLLNRMKAPANMTNATGAKGMAARVWNQSLDRATTKHGGVTDTGGIIRGADGKFKFANPNGATKQQKAILDGLNDGSIQNAIRDGGLRKDAASDPKSASAAEKLKNLGVNDANDLARALYGDRAFKHGENYSMATMAKGDKTGADYMVLSGVDQNGALVARASRVPGDADSRISQNLRDALNSPAEKYDNAKQRELGTSAKDSHEQAMMENGYTGGYKDFAKSMLGDHEASKYDSIDSVELTDDGNLKFTGKDKNGAELTSTVSSFSGGMASADGERLLNANNSPIAEIDKNGNVSAYNYSGDGVNMADIPVQSTYVPPAEPQHAPFSSVGSDGDNHPVPVGFDLNEYKSAKNKGDVVYGFENAGGGVWQGYATENNTPSIPDGRDEQIGKLSIESSKVDAIPQDWDGYNRMPVGTYELNGKTYTAYMNGTEADGKLQSTYVSYQDENGEMHKLYNVTEEESSAHRSEDASNKNGGGHNDNGSGSGGGSDSDGGSDGGSSHNDGGSGGGSGNHKNHHNKHSKDK